MKRFLILFLLVVFCASNSFALARQVRVKARNVPIDRVLPCEEPPKVLPADTAMPHNPADYPSPAYGVTIGVAGDYAALGYSRPDYFVEIGTNGQTQPLIKAGGVNDVVRLGLVVSPGLALFTGLEYRLNTKTTISADILIGDNTKLPTTQLSLKVAL